MLLVFVQASDMSSAGNKRLGLSKKFSRTWTIRETVEFYCILADPNDQFLSSLEKLALKKSSNNEVFLHIKDAFDDALKDKKFYEENEQNFLDKDGNVVPHEKLDTNIDRDKKQKTLKASGGKLLTL